MGKELIFMGRKEGKVRLALFDNSHGTARKLPVKEVSEDVFAAGIKNGSLPVRGFSVNNGRIICKYGDWYKLPEVGDNGALSLFGIVQIGKVEVDAQGYIPNIPSAFITAKQVNYYGIASVDWDTGMFRVMAPGTYWHMSYYSKVLMYTYDGPITKGRLQPKVVKSSSEDSILKGVDYIFEECDSTETIAEIAQWMRIYEKSAYVYFQWLYQRCEGYAVKDTDMKIVQAYFTKAGVQGAPEGVMLGKRPLDVLEIPANVSHVAVLQGRKVNTIRVSNHWLVYLYGFDDVIIECEKVVHLYLSSGTRARLIRNDDSPSMYISGWEGFIGSDGDYTGYNIVELNGCFLKQPDVDYLIFDVERVHNSFQNMFNVKVEFTRPLRLVGYAFCDFQGTLIVEGMLIVEKSFVNCILTNVLNLSQTQILKESVNKFKGAVKLPEFFVKIEGKVFKETDINFVKICPDLSSFVGVLTLTVENPELTVEVHCVRPDTTVEFYYGELKDLYYTAAPECKVPKFNTTSIFPTRPATGVTQICRMNFKDIRREVLDFGLFPDVSVIPELTAYNCHYTTIIFGPNVRKIESRAFVNCDGIRWVYIPETVTEIGLFIQPFKAPYTIFTQKGSEADKFAKKNNLEVRYVDDVTQFNQEIHAIPEALEAAVVVATLAGTGDGEESAVLMACEKTEMLPNLEQLHTFQEKAAILVSDVDWLALWAPEQEFEVPSSFCPRLHIVMSQISNSAEYNKDVVKVLRSAFKIVKRYSYASTQYKMVGGELDTNTAQKYSTMVWAVLKGDIVINAFTEQVSDKDSNCGIKAMLEQAKKLDESLSVELDVSNLSNVVEHLNFSDKGVSVLGKLLPYKVERRVTVAMKGTYVPLGIYKYTTGMRACITVDITTNKYVALILSSGVSLDDGKLKHRFADVFTLISRAICGAKLLENLDGWTRIYSLIGAGDAILKSCIGQLDIMCEDYDYSIPTTEIESLRVILRALSGFASTSISLADLKKALKNCGLTKPVTQNGWSALHNKRGAFNYSQVYYCKDGMFHVYGPTTEYISWFVLGERGEHGIFAFALGDSDFYYQSLSDKLRAIVDLYDTDFSKLPWREEHYAHVNCMLPMEEFLLVRKFYSGGEFTNYASFDLALVVSKLSGKICVAALTGGKVIPIFWTNTFAKVIRILEICSMTVFNYYQEWLRTASLCVGLFDNAAEFQAGIPTFGRFNWMYMATREYLRRGYGDGYVCVKGKQELFDLALKSPRTSDYKEKPGV